MDSTAADTLQTIARLLGEHAAERRTERKEDKDAHAAERSEDRTREDALAAALAAAHTAERLEDRAAHAAERSIDSDAHTAERSEARRREDARYSILESAYKSPIPATGIPSASIALAMSIASNESSVSTLSILSLRRFFVKKHQYTKISTISQLLP